MNRPKIPIKNQHPRPPSAKEAKPIEIKADRVDLPPSIAGNSFHNLLYGPMAGQPSKAAANEGPRKSSLVFWALLVMAVFCIYYFRSTDQGSSKNIPPPQSRPTWP